MEISVLIEPTAEPVSVADAKTAARLDGAHWDGIVAPAIAAARAVAEHETGRPLMKQTLRVALEDWPTTDDKLPVYRPSAVAVSYWNGSAWVALDSMLYVWTPRGTGFLLAPVIGQSWPTLGEVAIGPRVRVDATAGAETAAALHPAAVLFVKAMVAVMANDPTLTATDALASSAYLPRILDPIRLYG